MKWQEYVSKIFFFKDRRSGPIKLIARAGRPRAAGYRVISSGNSVHVTITIASSRFLPSVPPERKFASVSYARLYRMSSPSLPPSLPPSDQSVGSKIEQKPLEMDFDRLFHPALPSFLLPPLFVEIFPRET